MYLIFKALIDWYIVYHCIKHATQLTKTMDSTTAPPSDVVEINNPDKDPDTIDD